MMIRSLPTSEAAWIEISDPASAVSGALIDGYTDMDMCASVDQEKPSARKPTESTTRAAVSFFELTVIELFPRFVKHEFFAFVLVKSQ